MQLKIIQKTAVWKSLTFKMTVVEAINAVESLEDDYLDFGSWVKIRMQELEEAIEQFNVVVKELNIPTKLSDLENDEGFLKEHQSLGEYAKKTELFSGDYNDLENKPEIPSTEGLATTEYVNGLVGDIDTVLSKLADESEAI